ncbi:MAG: sigma-70 family RNA polymerase sigma factor, partial [Planctomycetota bacterium]
REQERRLIELAADGDSDAATQLIRAHQASLYAFMLRMTGRPEHAEDIVQDAFVRVLANLDRFDPRFRFSTWLFTIAKRLWMNAAAKSKPVYNTEVVDSAAGRSNAGGWGVTEQTATDADERSVAQQVLKDALDTLPAEQREIIVLFHQLDWPITRISKQMSMPEGTVKSHLHRGRKKLREAIESSTSREAAAVYESIFA